MVSHAHRDHIGGAFTLLEEFDIDSVWKEGEEVSVAKVIENLNANVANAKSLLRQALPRVHRSGPRRCSCATALRYAVFTQPHAMNRATRKKLDLLIGKYVR